MFRFFVKTVIAILFPFTILFLALFVSWNSRDWKENLLPTPPLLEQLNAIDAKRIHLTDNFVPMYVESIPNSGRYIIFAFLPVEGVRYNDTYKALFLVDVSGKIISKTEVDSSCGFPYWVERDNVLYMDMCKLPKDAVYQVIDDSIVQGANRIIGYTSQNSRRLVNRIKTDGSDNVLTPQITYNITCVDNWGSCRATKARITTAKGVAKLEGYSMRDYAKIDANIIAIIIGAGSPVTTSSNNQLFVIN